MLVKAVTASLICSPSTEIPLPQCFDVLIKHCRGRLVKKRSRALSPPLFMSDRVQCVVTAWGWGASCPTPPHQAPKTTRRVVSVQPSPFYTHVTGSVTDRHVHLFLSIYLLNLKGSRCRFQMHHGKSDPVFLEPLELKSEYFCLSCLDLARPCLYGSTLLNCWCTPLIV